MMHDGLYAEWLEFSVLDVFLLDMGCHYKDGPEGFEDPDFRSWSSHACAKQFCAKPFQPLDYFILGHFAFSKFLPHHLLILAFSLSVDSPFCGCYLLLLRESCAKSSLIADLWNSIVPHMLLTYSYSPPNQYISCVHLR
jgi:hypothetical protein